MATERIIIGADHAGFSLKEALKPFLEGRGFFVADVGTDSEDSVDYPDFGKKVAEAVSTGLFPRGILICGSGIGMSIVANRFPAVRGALCLDPETARLSRLHNDSNVLVLAGRKTGPEIAKNILQTWLDTPFEGGRHKMRLEKMAGWEREAKA
ncbi:MAG: ribose 5-phosphate isomerase B [Syntrophales bacterium]